MLPWLRWWQLGRKVRGLGCERVLHLARQRPLRLEDPPQALTHLGRKHPDLFGAVEAEHANLELVRVRFGGEH
jgi:hypothetical protein